ncbi:MAG TPA: hypothetical protein VFO40_23095 [Chthoniobacterales bacterium]|nr:hypothetical protein [Chthoniobacterales bacterium]
MPAATIAILQATRLSLHLGSGRFKNEEPGASRTCHFAGRPPCSVRFSFPLVDRVFVPLVDRARLSRDRRKESRATVAAVKVAAAEAGVQPGQFVDQILTNALGIIP